jgi:hypothetical protein
MRSVGFPLLPAARIARFGAQTQKGRRRALRHDDGLFDLVGEALLRLRKLFETIILAAEELQTSVRPSVSIDSRGLGCAFTSGNFRFCS